jgi:putative DNA primase/helicase
MDARRRSSSREGSCRALSQEARLYALRLLETRSELRRGSKTALSASELFGVPCWAAVNAGMLAAWLPPAETQRIIIFGDNDPNYAGQAATFALARRLGSEGRIIEVQIPAEVGADWNDVHQLQLARVEQNEKCEP